MNEISYLDKVLCAPFSPNTTITIVGEDHYCTIIFTVHSITIVGKIGLPRIIIVVYGENGVHNTLPYRKKYRPRTE